MIQLYNSTYSSQLLLCCNRSVRESFHPVVTHEKIKAAALTGQRDTTAAAAAAVQMM